MILKEIQSPSTGKVILRVTDEGFFVNGGSRSSGVGKAEGSKCWSFGRTENEGHTMMVVDETLSLIGQLFVTLTSQIPAGAVLWSAQVKTMETAPSGGDVVGVGLGPVADPDKYGSAALIPDFADLVAAVLLPDGDFTPRVAAETVRVNAVNIGGTMGDTAFTDGFARVRMVYEIFNSLEQI